eukprot:gene14293-20_t
MSTQNSSQQYSGGESRVLQDAIRTCKPRGRSGPKSRFSPFIGVSQYKRTGRWEAHIWDSTSSTKGNTVTSSKAGKGRQLHLGSFLTAAQAARAYDRAAILLRGPTAALNFPLPMYQEDPVLEELSHMSRQEMVLALRKTCDMELEAAAVEAFQAKVPAAAAHLLHNLTGAAAAMQGLGNTGSSCLPDFPADKYNVGWSQVPAAAAGLPTVWEQELPQQQPQLVQLDQTAHVSEPIPTPSDPLVNAAAAAAAALGPIFKPWRCGQHNSSNASARGRKYCCHGGR